MDSQPRQTRPRRTRTRPRPRSEWNPFSFPRSRVCPNLLKGTLQAHAMNAAHSCPSGLYRWRCIYGWKDSLSLTGL